MTLIFERNGEHPCLSLGRADARSQIFSIFESDFLRTLKFKVTHFFVLWSVVSQICLPNEFVALVGSVRQFDWRLVLRFGQPRGEN